MARLFRLQGLLVYGRLTLGRGFERKGRTNRLAGAGGHLDVVGGIGLQIDETRAVVVAARLLDGVDRPGEAVGVGAIVHTQICALFRGPGDLCRIGVGKFQHRLGDIHAGLLIGGCSLIGCGVLRRGKAGTEQQNRCDSEQLHRFPSKCYDEWLNNSEALGRKEVVLHPSKPKPA